MYDDQLIFARGDADTFDIIYGNACFLHVETFLRIEFVEEFIGQNNGTFVHFEMAIQLNGRAESGDRNEGGVRCSYLDSQCREEYLIEIIFRT